MAPTRLYRSSSGRGEQPRGAPRLVRLGHGVVLTPHVPSAAHGTPSARSSPASPARTAPTSPSCCWARATRSTASSAAPARSRPGRIDHLYHDPHESGARLFLHYADLTDSARRSSATSTGSSPTRSTTWAPRATSRSASRCPSSRPRRRPWARSGCWRPIRTADWPIRFYQAGSQRDVRHGARDAPDARRRPSTRAARTPSPRSSPTG